MPQGKGDVRRLLTMAPVQTPFKLMPITHEHVRGGDYYAAHGGVSTAGGRRPQATGVSAAVEVAHAA